MKKIFLVLVLVFLVGCGAKPAADTSSTVVYELESQIIEKDNTIANLEYQVEDLTATLDSLQNELDAVQANPVTAEVQPSKFMCDDPIDNMKYQNPSTAIAVLEGWFAVRPQVQEIQGTYSTQFWNDVKSRIHTIRYISTEDGLTATATFMIMFEEGGWQEGLLDMTEQCWLNYPY